MRSQICGTADAACYIVVRKGREAFSLPGLRLLILIDRGAHLLRL